MNKKIEMMESIKMMQIDLLNQDKKYDFQENDNIKNGEERFNCDYEECKKSYK